MRFDCPASWHDFQDEASVLTFQQPQSHLERRQLEKALRQKVGKLKRSSSTLSQPASMYFIRVQVGTNQPQVWNAGTLAAEGRKNKAFFTDANKACRLYWDNFLKVFADLFTGAIAL
ncbi:hypothetical protein [Trichocoleus sp. DQ-U1]|uniref:hypothetical protein n=1 Tax=Trichocoleus sp. DQ-U1 TaxID=2933926 RepID=UPI003297203D